MTPLAHAQENQNLIDKLLSILGTKNLPRVDIPPPGLPVPAPQNPPAPANAAQNPNTKIPRVEVARNFLPVYPLDREPDATPFVIPFFSSAPITEAQPGIMTLLIMVPDRDREAARAFAFARSAADEAEARHPEWNAPSTFLFAPQFLLTNDVAEHANEWPDRGAALLAWANDGWAYGADSVTLADKSSWLTKRGISSFAAMDYLLLILARPRIFPDLRRIIIAGTGMGGDFVQRYAVLGVTPDILAEENIEVRFVVSQARSYAYLDKARAPTAPVENDDNPLPPLSETAPPACPALNIWPFGLDRLPPYGQRQGDSQVRLRYGGRHIYYMVGEGATLPLPDMTPQACALNAQGPNTKERAMRFYERIQQFYGAEASASQKLNLVPRVNEDGLSLWRSPCGQAVLFGDGVCDKAIRGISP